MDPVNGAGPVTQVFGANPHFSWQRGHGHLGCDWGVKIGTSVVSIANDVGTVLFADWGHKMPAKLANECMFIVGSPNSGICVVVQYDGWRAVFAHLDSTHLNPGDKLRRGEIVGKSGNTGNSTGPHLHKENWVGVPASNLPPYGRYNPLLQVQHEDRTAAATPAVAPVQPAANVRKVGPHSSATFRDQPNLDGKVVATAAPNAFEAFLGYVVDTELSIGGVTSNMWYVDKGEDGKGKERYSWAGLYTEQRTAGLPNLTAPDPGEALAPNQRMSGPGGAIQRPEPKVGEVVVRSIPGGQKENFSHYAYGQEVTRDGVTSALWYKDSFGWVWAGAFTEQSTRGLAEWVEPAKPTDPVPEVDRPYTFEKSVPSVTHVYPAHRSNFEVGNFPQPPDELFFHQFNGATPEEEPVTNRHTVHIGSVENSFTRKTDRIASAHWAIEAPKVDQFLKHTDRAYHAGPDGNGAWSCELYGGMDAETIRLAGQLVRELDALRNKMGKPGRLKLRTHDEVAATKCGRHVDLDAIRRAAYPEDYAQTPAPAPVPVPDTPKTPELDRESIIRDYQDWQSKRDLQSYLSERK